MVVFIEASEAAMKYNIRDVNGKRLNNSALSLWAAERLQAEYLRMFGWVTTVEEASE